MIYRLLDSRRVLTMLVQALSPQSTMLAGGDLYPLEGAFIREIEVPVQTDIICAERPRSHIHVLLDGWAYRQVLTEDGRRHVAVLYLPGDVIDIEHLVLPAPSTIVALVRCRIALLSLAWIEEARRSDLAVAALLLSLMAKSNEAMAHMLAALGRRTARQRVAYLICHLAKRLKQLNLRDGERMWTPLTQRDLADALSLSTVHVNRTMRELEAEGVIATRGRNLSLLKLQELAQIAHFEAD